MDLFTLHSIFLINLNEKNKLLSSLLETWYFAQKHTFQEKHDL